MTFNFYAIYLLLLLVWYNAINATRLRWRVMARAGGGRGSFLKEQSLAVFLVAGPAVWTAVTLELVYTRTAATGDTVSAVVVCIFGFGIGTAVLAGEIFSAWRAFLLVRKLRLAKAV